MTRRTRNPHLEPPADERTTLWLSEPEREWSKRSGGITHIVRLLIEFARAVENTSGAIVIPPRSRGTLAERLMIALARGPEGESLPPDPAPSAKPELTPYADSAQDSQDDLVI